MFCSKNVCGKFLFFSLIVLLISISCNTFLATASSPRETYKSEPAETVQVQQKIIIDNLKRIEHKLDN